MEIEVQEKKHSYYTKSDHLGAMMRQIILSVYILFNLHLRQGMEQGSGEAGGQRRWHSLFCQKHRWQFETTTFLFGKQKR